MPLGKHFEHIALHLLVVDKLSAEIPAKSWLRNIILCRTESSRGQHDFGLSKCLVYGIKNLITVVAYHFHTPHIPSKRIQMTGYPARISVGDLPYEQLIADYND